MRAFVAEHEIDEVSIPGTLQVPLLALAAARISLILEVSCQRWLKEEHQA
jgi:hypothetical protein